MYDLVIKNGTVIDGSGSKRFRNDIAVKDGIIVKLAQNIEMAFSAFSSNTVVGDMIEKESGAAEAVE